MRLIDADRLLKRTKLYVLKNGLRAIDEIDILHAQTVKAIPIPDNVTNGDMFLKAHPEVVATIIKKKGYLFSCVQLRNKEETIPFAEMYIDWWNAPYKGVTE